MTDERPWPRGMSRAQARGPAPLVALEAAQVSRPVPFDGLVEIVEARAAAVRAFPVRQANTLGMCFKRGGAHNVTAEGRFVTFPADSLCVRTPGCAWGANDTGASAFVSVDVDVSLLPPVKWGRTMSFAPREALPHFELLVRRLLRAPDGLAREEILHTLVSTAVALAGYGLNVAPSGRQQVRRVREFLGTRIASWPSLNELAAASGANKHVLVRDFRKEVGVTPHQYLVALKVEGARRALASGDTPVEAAARFGFSDQPHLTRWFRRHLGVTPGRYREAARRGRFRSIHER